MINIIKGNLIKLAKQGKFDVIAHGCNCFCTMGAGIAVAFKKEFKADKFPMEQKGKGDYNKHGQIDSRKIFVDKNGDYVDEGPHNIMVKLSPDTIAERSLIVVNAYTQYNYGGDRPLDYTALRMCMRKINHTFKGKHIGLPMIGCGLAGGIWDSSIFSGSELIDIHNEPLMKERGFDGNGVLQIIEQELKDCKVTIVEYDK